MAASHTHDASHAHSRVASGGPAAPDRRAHRRRLGWTLCLSLTTLVAEVAGGLWSGSLALLADAGHMASDSAALCLALVAIWVAGRPPTERRTFGNARAEILAAWLQGLLLFGVAAWVVVEALERFGEPRTIVAPVMLSVAALGLAVNLVGLTLLGTHRHESLNIRGAWLHVMSDTLGSVGAVVAGGLVWAFGWSWADPAVSLVIAGLIVTSAWPLVRDAMDVLMEASPPDLDLAQLRQALEMTPGVESVHELHVWRVGHTDVSISCHLVVSGDADDRSVLSGAREQLRRDFSITHATLQLEPGGAAADRARAADCGLVPGQ